MKDLLIQTTISPAATCVNGKKLFDLLGLQDTETFGSKDTGFNEWIESWVDQAVEGVEYLLLLPPSQAPKLILSLDLAIWLAETFRSKEENTFSNQGCSGTSELLAYLNYCTKVLPTCQSNTLLEPSLFGSI
jgi:hypothetical protein